MVFISGGLLTTEDGKEFTVEGGEELEVDDGDVLSGRLLLRRAANLCKILDF